MYEPMPYVAPDYAKIAVDKLNDISMRLDKLESLLSDIVKVGIVPYWALNLDVSPREYAIQHNSERPDLLVSRIDLSGFDGEIPSAEFIEGIYSDFKRLNPFVDVHHCSVVLTYNENVQPTYTLCIYRKDVKAVD